MRLAVLGPAHPFRGGIAQTTTCLAEALRERGHEVRFLTPRSQYPGWLYPGRDDRDTEACPWLEWSEPVLEPLRPTAWSASRRSVVAWRADVWVLPYWTWAWAGWWRFLLAGDLRPPAVAVVHNPEDHCAHALQRLAARVVLGRCDGLFTHARALEEALAADYPWLPIASHLLPSTRHTGASQPMASCPGGPGRTALFLGLIRSYKGVDVLLEAVSMLDPRSPWRLVVAGEAWGDLGDRLIAHARSLGVSARVSFRLGWVPETEVDGLMSQADLVVLPYRSGSQSAVAPRALAAGVPVLTTRVGGLAEAVRDGVDGVVVEPGSAAALAGALSRLDDRALTALRRGAIEGATRVGWQGYAEALESVLDAVIAVRPERL